MKKDVFLGKSRTFSLVDEAGKTLSSFTLDDEHKAVSIYVELPRLGVLCELVERRHAYEQLAFVDGELEDEAELMVALDVVDDLHDRTVVV